MIIIDELFAIKSGKKELRKFSYLLSVVSVLIALYLYWIGENIYYYLLISGFVFAAIGFALPTMLFPLHKLWMGIAVILGYFISRIILGLLFYIVFTIIGLIVRVSGKDLLDRDFDRNAESYWITREKKPYDRSLAENQY